MHDRPSDGGDARDVARQVGRSVARAAVRSEAVQETVSGVLLLGLMVIFVPLGLGLLVVAALVFYVLASAVPVVFSSAVGGIVGGAYWMGVLVVMFFVFRRAYRWLARRSGLLRAATSIGFDDASDRTEDLPEPPRAAAPAAVSLAELDARMAPSVPVPGPQAGTDSDRA